MVGFRVASFFLFVSISFADIISLNAWTYVYFTGSSLSNLRLMLTARYLELVHWILLILPESLQNNIIGSFT